MRKFVFIDRTHLEEGEQPIIVIDPRNKVKRYAELTINGPCRVVFDPAGPPIPDGGPKVWIEYEE